MLVKKLNPANLQGAKPVYINAQIDGVMLKQPNAALSDEQDLVSS